MKMHLDGARSLNAALYLGITPKQMTKDFDTVTVCLSKSLGCPIGSVIVGKKKDIDFARMLRKLVGGAMC